MTSEVFAKPINLIGVEDFQKEVTLVKWNEPYQKLASCDSSGVIFVWIKYEGRWSIELINDRNTQVTDFAWSHDGRMALICYRDGFVLVGSVAGQRYWSSTLHLDRAAVLCGIWTPDDHQARGPSIINCREVATLSRTRWQLPQRRRRQQNPRHQILGFTILAVRAG
ncbi:hypothetical protein MTO96_008084 [Rhipicephalus appendiculatus]